MMVGIIRLLLTNRGLNYLLISVKGRGLRTKVNLSCVVAILDQANTNKGPGLKDAQLNQVINEPLQRSRVSMR